jgi:hypothetical protein
MELSELQKELILLFKAYEMTEDEVIGVMLLLKKPSQQKAMRTWIESHTAATIDEVIQEAVRLRDNQR